MHRSIAIAFALTLSCVAATASAEQCEDKLQQDKSQQNSADEAQVRGAISRPVRNAPLQAIRKSRKEERGQSRKAQGRREGGRPHHHRSSTYQGIEASRVAASGRLYCATDAQEFLAKGGQGPERRSSLIPYH